MHARRKSNNIVVSDRGTISRLNAKISMQVIIKFLVEFIPLSFGFVVLV